MGKVRMKLRGKDFGRSLKIASAVAATGIAIFLIVEFGPWTRQARNPDTTKAAAKSVGASVTPTEPKPEIEPKPPGPKRIEPAAPN